MSDEIVVVGAGMGGLVAAMLLASQGHSVRVLELGEEVGGKAGTATVQGMTFDTGPSLLTLPSVFEQLFAMTGVQMSERVVLRRTAQFDYVYPDGTTLRVSDDPSETAQNVADVLGDDAGQQLRDFFAYTADIWAAAAPHFVFGDAPQDIRPGALSPGMLRALTRIDAFGTMWDSICKRVRDERLRWLLARYATYNGSDVRTAPATLNCIAHVELGLGGYGVEGGIGALMAALRLRAEELGVVFEFGQAVEQILLDRERVSGVRLADNRTVPASAVICNVDPSLVFESLLRGSRRSKASRSTSGWTWVFEAEPNRERAPHSVLFPTDYTREFEDLFDHQRSPADPTVYVCDQSVAHGRTSTGKSPVFAMVNAPARVPDSADRARLTAHVESRLLGAGLRRASDAIVWTRGPDELAKRFPGSQGSIYGSASNSKLDAFRRPANRVRKVPGLYLASGGAHPGGGLPLCALSGAAAVRALLSDRGIRTADELRVDPAI